MNENTSIEYAVNYFSPVMCKFRKLNHSQLLSTILDSGIDGEITEFGSYTGDGSTMVIAAVMHNYKTDKTLHLYDSFQGLSKFHSIDLRTEDKGVHEGMFQCSQETLVNNLMTYDINKKIHPGWFNETLSDQLPQQICYAHIDCDLYEPILFALKEIYQRLTPGAICIVDDYDWHSFPGAAVAVDEFLADKPEDCQLLPNTIHCYFTKL